MWSAYPSSNKISGLASIPVWASSDATGGGSTPVSASKASSTKNESTIYSGVCVGEAQSKDFAGKAFHDTSKLKRGVHSPERLFVVENMNMIEVTPKP